LKTVKINSMILSLNPGNWLTKIQTVENYLKDQVYQKNHPNKLINFLV